MRTWVLIVHRFSDHGGMLKRVKRTCSQYDTDRRSRVTLGAPSNYEQYIMNNNIRTHTGRLTKLRQTRYNGITISGLIVL